MKVSFLLGFILGFIIGEIVIASCWVYYKGRIDRKKQND